MTAKRKTTYILARSSVSASEVLIMGDEERQASADEIVDCEVNHAMLAAGMRAHERFAALSESEQARRGRADMVAMVYGAMEATRRRALSESSATQ